MTSVGDSSPSPRGLVAGTDADSIFGDDDEGNLAEVHDGVEVGEQDGQRAVRASQRARPLVLYTRGRLLWRSVPTVLAGPPGYTKAGV